MPSIQLNFTEEINTSAQIGDNVYYIATNVNGEFDFADVSNILNVGYPISNIQTSPNIITINYPSGGSINVPPSGSFIMFGKNNKVNMSSLIGYFAKARFENNSNKKIELFTVASDITESSKHIIT